MITDIMTILIRQLATFLNIKNTAIKAIMQ